MLVFWPSKMSIRVCPNTSGSRTCYYCVSFTRKNDSASSRLASSLEDSSCCVASIHPHTVRLLETRSCRAGDDQRAWAKRTPYFVLVSEMKRVLGNTSEVRRQDMCTSYACKVLYSQNVVLLDLDCVM